jgi:hypothetical protein
MKGPNHGFGVLAYMSPLLTIKAECASPQKQTSLSLERTERCLKVLVQQHIFL